MKFPFRYLDTITKFLWTEYFGMFVQIRLIRPNFSGVKVEEIFQLVLG